MPNRSTHRNMLVAVALAGAVEAVPISSAKVDCLGADAAAFFVTPTAVGGPAGAISLQHSDDDITYVAVPANEVESGSTVLTANVPVAIAYLGNKRFVKARITPDVSTTHSGVIAVKSELDQVAVNPALA